MHYDQCQSYGRTLHQYCIITVINSGIMNIPASSGSNPGSRDVSATFLMQCTHPINGQGPIQTPVPTVFSKCFLLPGPYGLAWKIKCLHCLRHSSTSIQGQGRKEMNSTQFCRLVTSQSLVSGGDKMTG
ncbi:hypothetical protein EV421DRAFT_1742194 [Armillaria borealis]|uniref:Uncharacterized protein n=1 Tax=Armillaria borealis TaxID=47425 RepID=A0AA39MG71_9AGAR|nr:hypothetical protein EV421DRAFT_1742194 [Armillaria borealis]